MEELSKDRFYQAIEKSDRKVIVKFFADWCPDCRHTDQGSEEIANQFADKFAFYKVDVDKEQKLAEKYKVKGIPSFLVFAAGKEVDRLYSRDAKTAEQILEFVKGIGE